MATITIALMDPPYEAETTTTAMRIMDAAVRKGHQVNVFAYEGAVNLTMKDQEAHPNPVKGTTAEEEDIPPAEGTLLQSTPSNPPMRPRKRLER